MQINAAQHALLLNLSALLTAFACPYSLKQTGSVHIIVTAVRQA